MEINNTNEFTKNNCYIASVISDAIYSDKKIKLVSHQLGMSCTIYNIENHRAAILRRPSFSIFVYCGTNDKKDAWEDMKYFQRKIPKTEAMVHIGIDDAFCELNKKMSPELSHVMRSGKNFMVSGHSFGGGLAVRHLVGLRNPNGYCYTFGGMRVGNPAMANYISIPVARVVNGNDIVPHLPFKKMPISGFKYSHVQQKLIHLNYDGSIVFGDRTLWGEIKERVSGIVGDVIDFDLIPDDIEDHSSADHVKILKQWEGLV